VCSEILLARHPTYPTYLEKDIEVDEVSGVLSTTDDIIKEIADQRTEIITTAVGLTVLEKIAGTIAKGISVRREKGDKTLNIIACEVRSITTKFFSTA
jgi:mannitol-1-phosphate/altronate dehydrogenase